jgi:hypothetical protein
MTDALDTAPRPPARRVRLHAVRPVRGAGGRAVELRSAILRTLRLRRRPTALEDCEIARVIRLQLMAEEGTSTSLDERLRAERTADAALRRLLRGALQRLEATHGRP